ncbi:hypothetical protein GY45DRAFT_428629 [Cubamyces sp. BRFM 1775]|nr:hypothetical protein GY45DRAFT_428629 [Cubamyces sp. BRFM 1775]
MSIRYLCTSHNTHTVSHGGGLHSLVSVYVYNYRPGLSRFSRTIPHHLCSAYSLVHYGMSLPFTAGIQILKVTLIKPQHEIRHDEIHPLGLNSEHRDRQLQERRKSRPAAVIGISGSRRPEIPLPMRAYCYHHCSDHSHEALVRELRSGRTSSGLRNPPPSSPHLMRHFLQLSIRLEECSTGLMSKDKTTNGRESRLGRLILVATASPFFAYPRS